MSITLTSLDASQIPKYTYDEETRSVRVSIVNSDAMSNLPKVYNNTDIKTIEVPVIIKEFQEIEKQVIVKEQEIKVITVPEVIREIEYREIEKPIIIEKIQIVKVEVPVITKEIQVIEKDIINYKYLFLMQVVTLGLIVISHFFK